MNAQADLRVLVVDDEPTVAAAHSTYVQRTPGFALAATVGTAREAVRVLGGRQVDLVLLDLHLPDGNGLDIVRALRSAAHPVDVLTITAAREVELVRGAVSLGIVGYLLKPFSYADLRERLDAYRSYRAGLEALDCAQQGRLDAMLWDLHRPPASQPPPVKGLSTELLDQVVGALRSPESPGGMSASAVAVQLGVSRVTARRYLQHLCDCGLAARTQRVGGSGRPEILFHWR